MIQLGSISDIITVMNMLITDMMPLIILTLGILIGLIIFDLLVRVFKNKNDRRVYNHGDDQHDDDDYDDDF